MYVMYILILLRQYRKKTRRCGERNSNKNNSRRWSTEGSKEKIFYIPRSFEIKKDFRQRWSKDFITKDLPVVLLAPSSRELFLSPFLS